MDIEDVTYHAVATRAVDKSVIIDTGGRHKLTADICRIAVAHIKVNVGDHSMMESQVEPED